MKRLPYLLILPAAVFFVLFVGVPLVMVGQLSLFKTDYIQSRFIGLGNYVRLLHDEMFWKAVVNCLIYACIMAPAQTIGATILALLLFDSSKRVQDVMRFVYYIPSFAAGIVLSKVWRWMFSQNGIVNYLLSLVHIPAVPWLLERGPGLLAVAMALILTGTGGQIVIILGAMLSIPRDILDAARIDGAPGWQLKRKVIVPMVMPSILMILMLTILGAMQMWETARFMTGGAPMGGTATIVLDIVTTGIEQSNYGLAAAKGVVMIGIIMVLLQVKRRIESVS